MKKYNQHQESGGNLRFLLFILLTAVQTSCIKETLYNTDHPDYGALTLSTVWDDRGEDIAVPDSCSVGATHASSGQAFLTKLSGTVNMLDELFPAGEYRIHVYNAADNITVNGATATVNYAAGDPGWLFTGMSNIVLEKDKDHSGSVVMHQRVRRLILKLDVTGDAAPRLDRIEAALSGVAGAINIETGNPEGNSVTVMFPFTQTDGKYSAEISLAGIAGNTQILSLTLYFADGNPSTHTLASDLSDRLAAFNANRKTPMTLTAILTVTPSQGGFSATIDKWTGSGGDIIAN
jgi:hypothetical protein